MAESASAPLSCWNCGGSLAELPLPLSRHEFCPHCAEPVHCCRQCRLFAPDRPDQCLEERAEHPTDRTAANFCDYFAPRSVDRAGRAPDAAAQGARSRLDDLFVDTSTQTDRESAGSAAAADPAGAPASDAPEPDAGNDPEAAARARLRALFGEDP